MAAMKDVHVFLHALLLVGAAMVAIIGADAGLLVYPCERGFAQMSFCDLSKSIEERVSALIGNLTLEEKILQLGNTAQGVPRLGLPPYQWWSEALHGVSNTGPGTTFGGAIPAATSFPEVLLSAASFNVTLWNAIGQVVSTEARAMYNMGQSTLTYWSPNINIFRDPRWGRGQETPGEDPLLTSMYAANFVQGLQSINASDPVKRLKVGACCKHYTAYDVDQWEGIDRFHFDAKVTAQDLGDTYNTPFQACVQEGNAACLMCSYNRINGIPSCADKGLLSDIVRDKWGLNGYIVSDCDSVEVMYDYQNYTYRPEQSVADSILAGLNLDCGYFLPNYTGLCVEEGLIEERHVDKSLTYLYTTLMRLGYFDGNPRKQQWGDLGPDDVCTDNHQKLATEAAKQGMVLLKNQNQTLPLSKEKIGLIAVIGPNADSSSMQRANYAGLPCRNTTALNGIAYHVDVIYEEGCGDGSVACAYADMLHTVEAAQQADAVVLVMGLDQSQEREGYDRTSLLLPGYQQSLIESVAMAVSSPVILVIMSGGPVDISFAQSNPKIHSIIWAGYPGEAGGEALASILFGSHNPSGRLPNTWYTQNYTIWPMTDMRMRPNPSTGYPGRTYRFQNSSDLTVYEFGHGLSYTNFSTSISASSNTVNLTTSSSSPSNGSAMSDHCVSLNGGNATVCDVVDVDNIKECPKVEVRIEVRNEGAIDGTNTVLLMWYPPASTAEALGAPLRQLIAFKPIWVPAKTSSSLQKFDIDVCRSLSLLLADGATRVVPLHNHTISVVESDQKLSILVI